MSDLGTRGQSGQETRQPSDGAVLLMAYGSPRNPGEIPAYYTHMRGGRQPSPEALSELERRYLAIGGGSPLQEIAAAQADALGRELAHRGFQAPVAVGMKHSAPFLEDALEQLTSSGAKRIVGLVLAPHYSVMSIGGYIERVEAAARSSDRPPELALIRDWHLDPGYIRWLAQAVLERTAPLPEPPLVIFTAHSLPLRLREMGDPYPKQLEETAAAVAAVAHLPRWTTAWQSVARTGEPWLGPELLDVVRQEARAGASKFVVCPCGFTADHLEVLYDLDLEAAQVAVELGVGLSRTRMPNSDPAFIRLLADLVQPELRLASP